jgi:polyferredoxin
MASSTEHHINPKPQGFIQRHRTAILLVGLLLFLPPLAIIFQVSSGDNDFCGTWCPRMFFTWRQGMSSSAFLFGFLRSFIGVLLVVGILLSTFFLGRWWCSHLCPVGGATELGSRLVPQRLKIGYASIPAPPVRYGYLAAYLIAPAIGIGSLCCNYCNFAAVPRFFGAMFTPADMAYFFRSAGLINLALLFLLGFLARGGRAYCNFLCPIGALDSLVNRFGSKRGKRFRVTSHRCTGCGHCAPVCPTWAISMSEEENTKAQIDHFSCMPCGQCEQICPEGAIHYGKAS